MATAATRARKGAPVSFQTFQWKGTDQQGRKATGEIRAKDINLARAELRRQNINVNQLKKGKAKSGLFSRSGRRIGSKDITLFTRQLATMMEAGIPMVQAIEIIEKGLDHEAMVKMLADIRVQLESGTSFSVALRSHSKHFDNLYINLGAPVRKIRNENGSYLIQSGSNSLSAGALINCAGLHADRVARLAGLHPSVQIVPFRGEYYQLKKENSRLVKHLIYPVPNPQMPFLGVHFTRMIDDRVEAGPNAVLAMQREGYRRRDISCTDLMSTLAFSGFWKMSARFWRLGIEEYARSFSKARFVKSLQRLIPELQSKDLIPGESGVRAQAVDDRGQLLDDFHIISEGRMVHVLNAPSPAATASLSIGEQIADQVQDLC